MFDRSKSIFFNLEPSVVPPRPDRDVLTDTFRLHIQQHTVRTYGVSIKFYDSGSDEPDRRIDYTMQVTIAPHTKIAGLWQVVLRKQNLLINRHKPDLVSEELAAYLMDAVNPIRVTVDQWLTIQSSIDNHDELLQNWPVVKQRIRDKYEGEKTERLLAKFEEQLSEKWKLKYKMEKDLFWKAFFAPMYGAYGPDLQREQQVVFPLRYKRQSLFRGTQTVHPEKTEYGTYKIAMTGNNKQQDTIRMNYDMDVNSGLLRHMVVEGWANDQLFLRFTAFQIGIDRHGESLEIEVQQEKITYPKKRGFWGLFR